MQEKGEMKGIRYRYCQISTYFITFRYNNRYI